MKKLILVLLSAILWGLVATTAVRADDDSDCDTPDPGDTNSFE